ncbi:MAG TPA: squalene/phytoene synthase family protein [Anaerolineales bacterium]|nr:squalene/phytoene synthase family protein [Anaerolineales bacterium]
MMENITLQPILASSITKAASQQTYYTIRFLVDRERVADAFRAYAYFRCVDDTLDSEDLALPLSCTSGTTLAPPVICLANQAGVVSGATRSLGSVVEAPKIEAPGSARIAFLERQKSLLEKCYRGERPQEGTAEERMLIELVRQDHEKNSGLQSYLRNMMQVMDFDANRRGKWVSQAELNEYTHWLAVAVTEAMHYFIGHGYSSPHDETRYLAVAGAHITHMLRDTFDDVQAGYYNIPREVLEAGAMDPQDTQKQAYRAWVKSRVQLAREYFKAGKEYLARVEQPRCRLAGLAYTARFEWLLDTIEQEGYSLRPDYSERKSFGTGLQMSLATLSSFINLRGVGSLPQTAVSQSLRKL